MSREKLRTVAIFTTFAGLTICGLYLVSRTPSRQPASTISQPPVIPPGVPPLGLAAPCVIDRVVDGDTLDCRVSFTVRVRLQDCWAPELRGDSKIAGLASKRSLEQLAPAGNQAILFVPGGTLRLADMLTLNRVIGRVYIDGKELSAAQVAAGAATATPK